MAAARSSSYTAPAAACAAAILTVLASANEPLTLAEIERQTGRTKSLVYRTLHELVHAEFVQRRGDHRYRLGISAFEVGSKYLAQRTDLQAVRDDLRELSEAAGESTNVGVLRDRDVLYLMKFEVPSTYVTIARVGGRVPASCTASGKALLAELAPSEVSARIDEPLPQMTPYSLATRAELVAELIETRERGYGRDVHEAVIGRAGIAMTIPFGGDGELAAISLSTDAGRFEQEEDALVGLLEETRSRVERDVASRVALGAR